jgi:hypothetical protein
VTNTGRGALKRMLKSFIKYVKQKDNVVNIHKRCSKILTKTFQNITEDSKTILNAGIKDLQDNLKNNFDTMLANASPRPNETAMAAQKKILQAKVLKLVEEWEAELEAEVDDHEERLRTSDHFASIREEVDEEQSDVEDFDDSLEDIESASGDEDENGSAEFDADADDKAARSDAEDLDNEFYDSEQSEGEDEDDADFKLGDDEESIFV